MKKTILLLLLVLCLVLPTVPHAAAASPTEAEVYEAMIAFKSQYPEAPPGVRINITPGTAVFIPAATAVWPLLSSSAMPLSAHCLPE